MRKALTAVLAASLVSAAPVLGAVPVVGQPARGNTFILENGQELSVDDLKGMVVVITYWVEDCRACDDQIKLLDYYARRQSDVGLVTLATSANVTPVAVFRTATRGTKVHAVTKVAGWMGPMDGAPTTYVIDRTGKVRYAGTGMMSVAMLNDVLLPVIREPQPAM